MSVEGLRAHPGGVFSDWRPTVTYGAVCIPSYPHSPIPPEGRERSFRWLFTEKRVKVESGCTWKARYLGAVQFPSCHVWSRAQLVCCDLGAGLPARGHVQNTEPSLRAKQGASNRP